MICLWTGQWEPLPPAHWFVLGEPVYFSAQAVGLLAGERLYVDSCHVTSSEESDRTPTVDIISNYGCALNFFHIDGNLLFSY